MIPITPTPPTNRPAEARSRITRKKIPVSWLNISRIWAEAMIGEVVLVGRPETAHPAHRRDHLVLRAIGTSTESSGTTMICAWKVLSRSRFTAEVQGKIAMFWKAVEKMFSSG